MKAEPSTAAAVLAAALACFLALPVRAQDPYGTDRERNGRIIAEKAKSDKRYAALRDLAEGYGLVIGVREFEIGKGGDYTWDFLSFWDDLVLDPHVDALTRFWPKIPAAFVRRVGLNGILFVKNLRWNGLQVYGFELGDVVLFVNLTLGGWPNYPGDTWFEYGLFHEFFHVVQNRLLSDKRFIDYGEWKKLNAPGASYHAGGSAGILQEVGGDINRLHEEHPAPGFVSRYATADEWHDTTETFCTLLVTSRWRKAQEWVKSDGSLKQKLDYLRRALERIDPTFTEDYVRSLHAGRN